MTRVAMYARYSSEKQSEKSIDDQFRRCREVAERLGLSVSEDLVFFDAAISGTESGTHKRDGFRDFVRAWDAGAFDVFIVDELSRLSRDAVEQAKLIHRLEQNRRVRMLTVDGIDTHVNDWQLRLGLQGVLAQQDIRKLRHLVGRGMQGQLERGYMIATPAYGYDFKRIYDGRENRVGTHWVINETEAQIVRNVFQQREDGSSLHQIAAWLNHQGVPISRQPTREAVGFWRPSRVRILLMNTIYRGVFVWHGSSTHHYRANKRGDDVNPVHYMRPELRLVSDTTWHRCNEKTHSRSGYGGGKHFLAGLMGCGCCSGTLVLSAVSSRRSVYCAHCTVANAVIPGPDRLTSTVSVAGVTVLLRYALAQFLTPGFLDAVRASLHRRLSGAPQQALEECRRQLKHWTANQQRFSRMLQTLSEDDPVLEARYFDAQREVAKKSQQLVALEAGSTVVEKKALQAQLMVDPAQLLDGLLDADLAPQKLRALLSRLFPSVVFEGKSGRYTSFFRIRFAQGAVLAMASQTDLLEEGCIERRFKLNYKPHRRSGEAVWSVVALASEDDPV